MSDLQSLYQDVILDHSKRPRNFRVLEGADRRAEGYNPLCGDRLTLYLRIQDDRISDISFKGAGCAISTASASILTETLKGKTRAEAETLFEIFHDLVMGKGSGSAGAGSAGPVPTGTRAGAAPAAAGRDAADARAPLLGKLAVFSGVSEFPVRVKCATLAWHTLKSALAGNSEVASTEGADGEDVAAR